MIATPPFAGSSRPGRWASPRPRRSSTSGAPRSPHQAPLQGAIEHIDVEIKMALRLVPLGFEREHVEMMSVVFVESLLLDLELQTPEQEVFFFDEEDFDRLGEAHPVPGDEHRAGE